VASVNLEVQELKYTNAQYNLEEVPYSLSNGKVIIGEGILYGDVNGDGEADEWDVTYLARHLAGWNGYEVIDRVAADVSGDGEVDEWDVTYLARHLAGWNGYERLGPRIADNLH